MRLDSRLHFVRAILRFDELDSRATWPDAFEKEPLDTPALIWAERQTRGRGQRDNTWWSDEGSLTATLVLDPRAIGLTLARESRVAMTIASAVVEAIEELYPDCHPGLRWPNDIEILKRKLGGILPERVETPEGTRLLVGIGLNVRTPPGECTRRSSTNGRDSGRLAGCHPFR